MILTYSKEQFKFKIIAKIKIHTIREDKHDRWRPGMSIQHWLYSPRNVSKHPHQFGTSICRSKQKIEIIWHESQFMKIADILIEGNKITDISVIDQLAINDGFESRKSFYAWFNKNFTGKIIHWTEFKY